MLFRLAVAIFLLILRGFIEHGLSNHEAALDQLVVELRRRQRSRRQVLLKRHTHLAQDRARNLEHALQPLDALIAIGDAELIDEKGAVERMDAAKNQEFLQLRRRMRQQGNVRRAQLTWSSAFSRTVGPTACKRNYHLRLERHETALRQGDEHVVESLFASLDARLVHQPLADNPAHA